MLLSTFKKLLIIWMFVEFSMTIQINNYISNVDKELRDLEVKASIKDVFLNAFTNIDSAKDIGNN